MKFEPIKKVEESFVPVKKVTSKTESKKNVTEKPVPEWGRENPNLYGIYGAGKELYDVAIEPAMEGIGLVAGGMAGGVPGAALGYGMMKKTGETFRKGIDYLGGEQPPILELPQEMARSGRDILEGATIETGGKIAGKGLEFAAKGVGKIGAQAIGRLTGTGTAAAEEAFKSGYSTKLGKDLFKSKTFFDRALRGKISGEEVVTIARDALNNIKDARAIEYQNALAKITESSKLPAVTGESRGINVKPIADKLKNLMKQYNIKGEMTPDGPVILDTSRVAMGRKGMKDIKEVIQLVGQWGKQPEDFTAQGLDTLKRQLDDFYSDSSQARQFVASMRRTVADTIKKAVPAYDKMTKDYGHATQLIKDIESNLMMRKQGMSGRIVSDQTLRRLMSAMKDNFELRRGLVEALSNQGNKDVMGAVAGNSMRSWMPRGLAGTGPMVLGNAAIAKYITPTFWPVVIAASPRVSGEFLRLFGKFVSEFTGFSGAAGRAAIYGIKEIQGQ